MITVYFKNEELARLASAVSVDYKAARVHGESGALPSALPVLVCLDAEGKEIGAFLLSEIVGWDAEEWEEEEDEDD
jgi:hypothetical protein